jgi:hypothetical protein
MADYVFGQQWRDESIGSLYPFGDGATLVDASGVITLDRDMFLDATLYPIGGAAGLYLTQITVATALRQVTLAIGNVATPQLCSAVFDPLAIPAALVVEDAYQRPAGLLVCDPTRMAIAQTWPSGTYTFAATATPWAASCIIPLPALGVRGFTTAGGGALAGDVWLAGGDGVVLSFSAGAIQVDIVGDPLYLRRLCAPTGLFNTPRFVQTINGVAPNAQGDFQFTVLPAGVKATVLRVTPLTAGSLLFEAVGKSIA